MSPPGNSVDLKGAKKGKKSNSKDERKHRRDKHGRPAADEASLPNEAKRGKKPRKDEETHRLAVVNMDWDNIKAVDLYMVMISCVPKGGRVLSVSIYPSEFGLECMNIETKQGPSSLLGADEDENDNDVDGEDDGEHDSETKSNRLRAYELNRLRYYYAVVVCDSCATADHLYMTLDGTKFLKTANVFDLQFIRNSMEFKRAARDVATEAPPSYKEPDFVTPTLQPSKVELNWDDDEPDRKKILRRKLKENQLDDRGNYLLSDDSASDDDEDDSDQPNGVMKWKLINKDRLALLLQREKSDEEQTDDQNMEITFNMELKDLSKCILERKSTKTKTIWEKHQEKMKEKRKARKRSSKDDDDDDYSDDDSTNENDALFEDEKADEEVKPIKKQKEKKAKGKGQDKKLPEEHFEPEATKEELELLVAADQDAANVAKGYNIKRKSKKGKKSKDCVEDKIPEIDISTGDPRFSAMLTNHLYALDPTDHQYKRSATFMRKQARKKGAHADAGTLDSEPPVEKSPLGN